MKTGIFRIDLDTKTAEELSPTSFSEEGFLETTDIHEWLVSNPALLGEDLLVIGREHTGVQGSGLRPDILAIDKKGHLVIVEAKRDDSGKDIYWQAAIYAAAYWPRSGNEIVDLYVDYSRIDRPEAVQKMREHTESEDEQDLLKKLNAKQRLLLVARTFPKEVTTTVLWLKEQGVDVSCLELTPFPDRKHGTFYVQSRYIIPVPETNELMVRLRETQQERTARGAETESRQNDAITLFMRTVSSRLNERLSPDLWPSRMSRWAGIYGSTRYYKFWYDENPWKNHAFCFVADLETAPGDPSTGYAYVHFWADTRYLEGAGVHEDDVNTLMQFTGELNGTEGFEYEPQSVGFYIGKWISTGDLSETGADDLAEALSWLIERLVPRVRELMTEDEGVRPADQSGEVQE